MSLPMLGHRPPELRAARPVDGNGDIVTTENVVEGATSIGVASQDGTTRRATVRGKDDAAPPRLSAPA